MGISLKINAIAQQEFELSYYNVIVKHVILFATKIPDPLTHN